MTDAPSMAAWRPQGFDAMIAFPDPQPSGADADGRRRDGSSADLRERQRDLAFDMYAEALVRMADEDTAAKRSERRASA